MSDAKKGKTYPKHIQIYDDLKKSLQDGLIIEGTRLPSEYELANQYGVSRPTVTKALTRLKKEGLIIRRTGSGSFAALQQENNFKTQTIRLSHSKPWKRRNL